MATEVSTWLERVRAGLDIGFANLSATARFRSFRSEPGGVWMTVEDDQASAAAVAASFDPKTVLRLGAGCELPFDDNQFEVVLLGGALLFDSSRRPDVLREVHRVLRGGGLLIFAYDDATGGIDQRGVYEMLRDGFDVVGFRRPAWWRRLWLARGVVTVCARRKNWRNRGAPIVGEAMPVSSAMFSPRTRRMT